MNEAIPIGLLASKFFDGSEDVRISLKIGSQTFDATVVDGRNEGSGVEYIEVTVAHEGYDEHLRMKVLHDTGESGFGTVIKHGTNKTGLDVKIDRGMVSQAEILKREADLVAKAIDRKLDKPYPPNTLLVIDFDDRMAFDRRDNTENLEAVVSEYSDKLEAFHTVAIVGRYQGFFHCRRTSSAI